MLPAVLIQGTLVVSMYISANGPAALEVSGVEVSVPTWHPPGCFPAFGKPLVCFHCPSLPALELAPASDFLAVCSAGGQ